MSSAGEWSLLFAVSSWTVGSGVIPEHWRGGAVLLGLVRVQEAAGLIELMFANQDLGGQGWVQVC
jgi:hypothetical protein